ncbi:ABC transporter ATP-binding protein [Salinarchaeum sp. IM2453]|uniref:ABC transporter ATP-binding protein n=1 Tax=Salinarchaeum sp. IM2453 TaxID=2862870 RepID=UPI001C833C70|nr:ABC transporter ATP-binding protein [Salinarchaeum sp. IM2453]QZA87847.1 ABC transporter ATP-binding protein [Salinarchaeum sp. IM2453]
MNAVQSSQHESVVKLDSVRKEYDLGGTVVALDDISLELSEGSYTAVMGPSGSGKSTLLNLIGALDTPTSGNVVVDDQNVATLSESERASLRGTTIGFIFQTFNLMPRLTAVENVALPLSFAGVSREQRLDRAVHLLEQVGLGDRTDHLPPELSGGQRQRVAIARALISDPELILADEPTGNVDTETGKEIMQLLQDANNNGNTILLVTHSRRIAEHADQIVHFKDGELIEIEQLN